MALRFLVSSAGDAVGSADFEGALVDSAGLCFGAVHDFCEEMFLEKHVLPHLVKYRLLVQYAHFRSPVLRSPFGSFWQIAAVHTIFCGGFLALFLFWGAALSLVFIKRVSAPLCFLVCRWSFPCGRGVLR